MKNFLSSLITIICFLQSVISFSQTNSITISGIVLDSASNQPLPFVAIQIKEKPSRISSHEDGSFSISCSAGDTLIFTHLGYDPYLHITTQEEVVKVRLAENVHMLKAITIYDRIILPGSEQWKSTLLPSKPFKFENATMNNPPPGIMPTFGPGVIFSFGGKDKTKKKRDDLVKTEVFRTTINSPEVKKQLIDLYVISEATYYRKLEAFNKENPDVAYLTSRDEIISMLIQFFALKEP